MNFVSLKLNVSLNIVEMNTRKIVTFRLNIRLLSTNLHILSLVSFKYGITTRQQGRLHIYTQDNNYKRSGGIALPWRFRVGLYKWKGSCVSLTRTRYNRRKKSNHVTLSDVTFILDSSHTVTRKPLVLARCTDPVQSHGTVSPPYDTPNRKSLQRFFDIMRVIPNLLTTFNKLDENIRLIAMLFLQPDTVLLYQDCHKHKL